jgi:hypothetical protein
VSDRRELWAWRILGLSLLAVSAFGVANALVLKIDGPGGDLGVVAGVMAGAVLAVARRVAKRQRLE